MTTYRALAVTIDGETAYPAVVALAPGAPQSMTDPSLCQWDEVHHPDEMRPVVVVVTDTYGPDLGRMCRVHFLAVLQGRAQR